jgi:hypothetical protein
MDMYILVLVNRGFFVECNGILASQFYLLGGLWPLPAMAGCSLQHRQQSHLLVSIYNFISPHSCYTSAIINVLSYVFPPISLILLATITWHLLSFHISSCMFLNRHFCDIHSFGHCVCVCECVCVCVCRSLPNQGLVGPIPQEIGNLEYLRVLDLSNSGKENASVNQITGNLSALQGLTNLQTL